jgi:hypothetical protein
MVGVELQREIAVGFRDPVRVFTPSTELINPVIEAIIGPPLTVAAKSWVLPTTFGRCGTLGGVWEWVSGAPHLTGCQRALGYCAWKQPLPGVGRVASDFCQDNSAFSNASALAAAVPGGIGLIVAAGCAAGAAGASASSRKMAMPQPCNIWRQPLTFVVKATSPCKFKPAH